MASCAAEPQSLTRTSRGEAEQIVALLRAEGIAATATPTASGDMVDVAVDAGDISRAAKFLAVRGLPSGDTSTMASAFGEPGLVETPLEERARLSHAISSELSATLRQIDGVLSARVHILVPEAGYGTRAGTMPTASVALRTAPGIDEAALLPQVRRIVAGAVPNLSYENVAVAIFPIRATADGAGGSSLEASGIGSGDALGTGLTMSRLVLIAGAIAGGFAIFFGLFQILGKGRSRKG